jgi:hypothetical protein
MSASNVEPPQSYSQEDIQQILQIAFNRQPDKEEWTREQLWEIAAELNIEPGALVSAEQDWLNNKLAAEKKQDFDRFRRDRFKQKAARYLIVNIFLLSLNLIGTHTLSWSLYILLFWGLGLALSAWNTFALKGQAYEEAFQHWKFKDEMKQSMASLWDKIKKSWQT